MIWLELYFSCCSSGLISGPCPVVQLQNRLAEFLNIDVINTFGGFLTKATSLL